VGALSHYIEAEGVSTAGISLIRHQTAAIKPPRALWVPFELGRPFGPPNQPEFQIDVLRALLATLTEPSGPILADYPHDPPVSAAADEAPWACALPLPPLPEVEGDQAQEVQRIEREMGLLRTWYDESVRSRNRSVVGVSGLDVDSLDDAVRFLSAFAHGETPTPPANTRADWLIVLRFLADDLKAYYFEAAEAQPGRLASPVELNRWLFGETNLGDLLYRVRDRVVALGETDETIRPIGGGLVPGAFAQRPGSAG
jgi:hypothetical protein